MDSMRLGLAPLKGGDYVKPAPILETNPLTAVKTYLANKPNYRLSLSLKVMVTFMVLFSSTVVWL